VLKAPDQVEYLTARIVDAAGDWVTRGKTKALLAEVRDSLEEFVRRFMEAERRATDLADKTAGRAPGQPPAGSEVRMLVVDSDDRLFKTLEKALARRARGFDLTLAQTGGEALDYVTKNAYQIALIGPSLPDLPSSLVLRTLAAQAPETIAIAYEPNGRLEIIEQSRAIPLVDKFTAAQQLVDRIDELAEAHGAKLTERRYLAAFRERHYEFLRKLSDLRKKIDRAIEDADDVFKMEG
jgi:DNA-binding NarL/FixJ family response regulator